MSYYEFRGDGMALGSVIAVRAESEDKALESAQWLMAAWKLDPASLRLNKSKPELAVGSQIVYAWNGDY